MASHSKRQYAASLICLAAIGCSDEESGTRQRATVSAAHSPSGGSGGSSQEGGSQTSGGSSPAPSAMGGASSAMGGASSATGGVSSATGGVSSSIGGASSATGGVSSATGGVSSATGGVPSTTGGVSSAAGGSGNTNTGGRQAAGGSGGGASGGSPNPGCELAPLTEHVTFENPGDGRNGLSPFTAEVGGGNKIGTATGGPSAVQGQNAGYIEWHESNYANSRLTRGVEGSGKRVIGEVWYSYLLNIPSNGFPTNKRQAVGQFIAWHPSCETDKTIVVSLNNEKLSASSWFGDTPTNSYYVNSTANGERVLSEKLPRDTWLRVVLHVKTSNKGTGLFEGWLLDVAGKKLGSFSQLNINLGTGCFGSNGEMTYGVYPKVGLYAHDTANYDNNEVRTLYFDDVRVLHGNPPCAFESVSR